MNSNKDLGLQNREEEEDPEGVIVVEKRDTDLRDKVTELTDLIDQSLLETEKIDLNSSEGEGKEEAIVEIVEASKVIEVVSREKGNSVSQEIETLEASRMRIDLNSVEDTGAMREEDSEVVIGTNSK